MPHFPTRPARWLPLWAVLALSGCDETPVPTPTAASAVPTQDATVAAPLRDIDAPAEALVYGGIDSLESLLAPGNEVAQSLGMPGPALSVLVMDAITSELGLKAPGGIALDKPMRLVMLDPKKHAESPVIYIFTTSDQASFVQSLPADQQAAGNAHSWQINGKKRYANFIDNTVVVTGEPSAFVDNAAFLKKLQRAEVADGAAFILNVANATTLYKDDLKKGIAEFQAGMQGATTSAQVATLSKLVTWAAQSAEQLDTIEVRPRSDKSGFGLGLMVRPKPSTELEKTIRTIVPAPGPLLSKLPERTPVFLSMAVSPSALTSLRGLVEWSLSLGMGGKPPPSEFVDASMRYWEASTGEFVIAATQLPGTTQLTLVALTGIKDAERIRAEQRKMFELYADPEIAESYKSLGIEMKFSKAAYKIGDLEVDMTETKLSGAAKNPMSEMMNSLLSSHSTTTDDFGIVAYGPDAKAALQAFVSGDLKGGLDQSDGPKHAIAQAAPGAVALGYLSTAELSEALAPGAQGSVPVAAGPGLSVSVGSKDGSLHVTLDLPSEQALGIAMLAQLAQAAVLGAGGPNGAVPNGAVPNGAVPNGAVPNGAVAPPTATPVPKLGPPPGSPPN